MILSDSVTSADLFVTLFLLLTQLSEYICKILHMQILPASKYYQSAWFRLWQFLLSTGLPRALQLALDEGADSVSAAAVYDERADSVSAAAV